MAKYNPRLIKGRHSYSVEEIARLYGINVKTCLRWLREGLQPIQRNTKPLLIWGNDLRAFLVKREKDKKVSLKKDEFYCLKCKRAVRAKTDTEKTVITGKKIGLEGRKLMRRIGKCVFCDTELTRYL